jgi:hypothetical protein
MGLRMIKFKCFFFKSKLQNGKNIDRFFISSRLAYNYEQEKSIDLPGARISKLCLHSFTYILHKRYEREREEANKKVVRTWIGRNDVTFLLSEEPKRQMGAEFEPS